MTHINTIFLELLAVSIGRREGLSAVPVEEEWAQLYRMAREQAVAGVCFAGVQRLKVVHGICPPMPLYMQWLAVASQIQMRNEEMNQWSAEICRMIEADGYECCILKGQAVAGLYAGRKGSEKVEEKSEKLSLLRQSGDIDVWMMAPHKEVIRWGQEHGGVWFYDYHHADLMGFHDVEVELHYRPTLSRNLWRNWLLQRWLKGSEKRKDKREKLGCAQGLIDKSKDLFPVPTAEFALVLTLNHNFWHLLYEGVGMRQMMDLYFVLINGPHPTSPKGEECLSDCNQEETMLLPYGGGWEGASSLIKHFGLMRFAKACMWVMQEVFGLEREYMVCEPDERSGRFLLEEILKAGNFGHADVRLKRDRYGNRFRLMWGWMRHTWRLFRYYPADVLWTPFGVLYISLWRRWHYRFDKIKLDKKIKLVINE